MFSFLAGNNIGMSVRIPQKVKLGILLKLPILAFIADIPIEVVVTIPRKLLSSFKEAITAAAATVIIVPLPTIITITLTSILEKQLSVIRLN